MSGPGMSGPGMSGHANPPARADVSRAARYGPAGIRQPLSRASSAVPSGEPRPVQASQPGPAA
jgi:hypothetical protein